MKMILALALTCWGLVGCAQAPIEKNLITPDAIDHLNLPRIKVPVTASADHAAKTKALAGLDGDGWAFDTLYATAVNTDGRDLAVCGFARQRGTTNTVYFAYYGGELIVSDDKAPSGVSVENEFLTLICSSS